MFHTALPAVLTHDMRGVIYAGETFEDNQETGFDEALLCSELPHPTSRLQSRKGMAGKGRIRRFLERKADRRHSKSYHRPLGVLFAAGRIIVGICFVKLSVIRIGFLRYLEFGREG